MAKKKPLQKPTIEVAAPEIKTTTHKVIRAGFGLKVGQTIRLETNGVKFYKQQQIIL